MTLNTKDQHIKEAYRKIGDSEKAFDIEFWQTQGERAIFAAVLDMVRDYLLLREGNADQPRLQRTLESFQKV